MGARVLFRDSQGRDGQVDLNPAATLYVGRALDCAVRTDDAMVSRKHSMIRMESGRFYVEDLGSSNGTHVNDVRVTKHPLSHNDVVRCGSLWLRYIEEGPLLAPLSPDQSGGTRRLDPGEFGLEPGARPGPARQHGAPHRDPGPQNPQGRGGGTVEAGHARPSYLAGWNPEAGQPDPVLELFRGPPAMPSPNGIVGGDLVDPLRPAGPPIGVEDSIVIDFPERDAAHLHKELDAALRMADKLQNAYDREVADGKRLRAEIVTHKDRTDELRRALGERDEVVEAHIRVADELREELRQVKDSLASARTQESQLADLVAARERQLARNQEDIGQLKREIQDKERELAEVSRTKDDGWRRLNEQLTEIEHLREVITQQERMLEERRVGLISQEAIIVEVRAEKEKHLRETAQIKAEREELRSSIGRLTAQVAAIDEENRRLSQLLSELRGKRASNGEQDDAAAAHSAAVSAELKNLRIALKTVESDRDHLKQLGERGQSEVERLREQVARLEVELREAHDERDRAMAGKSVSDEATTRAELARHKAAEEAVAAGRARDQSAELAAELQRELDKLRRRLIALEEDTQMQAAPMETLVEENRRLERRLTEASEDIAALDREARSLRAELDAARVQHRATASRPAIQPPGEGGDDDDDRTRVVSAGHNLSRIRDRAIEVHDAINDVLSELRNNAMILHEEFRKTPAELSPDSSRIMKEATESLLGQAKEAKGVLRRLLELVEFGDE